MTEKDLVFSGYAGEAGGRRIAAAKQEFLRGRFRKSYVERLISGEERGAPEEAPDEVEKTAFAAGAAESIRVKQGGVLAALYDMARARNCGLRIHLRQIPIRQETVELCELFSLNPYRLYSNCLIFVADNGFRLAEQLNTAGLPSACAGQLTGGADKLIVDKQEIEYLNRPEPDELLKLLPDAVL
ncbi:MAG: AIR synthase-related protein [Stomatobaculum sp.]